MRDEILIGTDKLGLFLALHAMAHDMTAGSDAAELGISEEDLKKVWGLYQDLRKEILKEALDLAKSRIRCGDCLHLEALEEEEGYCPVQDRIYSRNDRACDKINPREDSDGP